MRAGAFIRLQTSTCTPNDFRSIARMSCRYSSGLLGQDHGIISMLNTVRDGLTASITLRAVSTVASKNALLRLSGCAANQTVGLNDPAMSTHVRAPSASAS